MSDDKNVAKELVETLRDGQHGFTNAAEKLRDSDRPEWATTLELLSQQRANFRREFVDLGHESRDDVDESGSVTAAPHREWISLKDELTGDDAGSAPKSQGRGLAQRLEMQTAIAGDSVGRPPVLADGAGVRCAPIREVRN